MLLLVLCTLGHESILTFAIENYYVRIAFHLYCAVYLYRVFHNMDSRFQAQTGDVETTKKVHTDMHGYPCLTLLRNL